MDSVIYMSSSSPLDATLRLRVQPAKHAFIYIVGAYEKKTISEIAVKKKTCLLERCEKKPFR